MLVDFNKGPAASYDAEAHGNGIYQCTDTGDTYIFGIKNGGSTQDDRIYIWDLSAKEISFPNTSETDSFSRNFTITSEELNSITTSLIVIGKFKSSILDQDPLFSFCILSRQETSYGWEFTVLRGVPYSNLNGHYDKYGILTISSTAGEDGTYSVSTSYDNADYYYSITLSHLISNSMDTPTSPSLSRLSEGEYKGLQRMAYGGKLGSILLNGQYGDMGQILSVTIGSYGIMYVGFIYYFFSTREAESHYPRLVRVSISPTPNESGYYQSTLVSWLDLRNIANITTSGDGTKYLNDQGEYTSPVQPMVSFPFTDWVDSMAIPDNYIQPLTDAFTSGKLICIEIDGSPNGKLVMPVYWGKQGDIYKVCITPWAMTKQGEFQMNILNLDLNLSEKTITPAGQMPLVLKYGGSTSKFLSEDGTYITVPTDESVLSRLSALESELQGVNALADEILTLTE